jgi:hypothetical protein
MSKLLQLRGGTTSQHNSFTGAVREVTVDTDKDTLVVHDGSTQGGFALPRTAAEVVALISNDSIDSQHYVADSIDAEHLAPNSVNTDAIIDDAVTSAHLAAGSVDTTALGADSVTTAKIADNVALGGSPTTTTQAESDDSTKIATTAYVVDKITTLIGGAPSTLNDLNELALAINDDASYNSTLTTALATKLPKAGGAMTGNITMAGSQTVDGRDLSVDGAKLDGIEASATADQTAAQIKTHLENGIDSVHYVDGSIDLAHMSSESVDEDNLHISNAGTNGFFLQKQSGNNGGLTWAEVPEGEDFIPNGSVMAFFQSAAPTGWTKVTSQNDKVLRVVSGNGGGTGGTWATNSGVTTSSVGAHTHTSAAHTHTSAAHTHTGASHTHATSAMTLATSQMPSHTHTEQGYLGNSYGWTGNSYSITSGVGFTDKNTSATGGGGSHTHGNTGATTPGTSGSTTPGATGSTTPGATGSANAHSHTISAPQYIDVIICSKDA